jgi:F-type H+-transporting ATPase subunit gamma
LRTLDQAITAMKSLSALHFRQARRQLLPAHAYRDGLERTLAGMALQFPGPGEGTTTLLVLASDLGLCGSYNGQLVAAAQRRRQSIGDGPVVCVGHRAAVRLTREGRAPMREHPAPTGTAALGQLLMQVVEELLDDFLSGRVGAVEAVSARFDGVGSFTPVVTPLLPIRPPPPAPGPGVSPYVSAEQAAVVGLRELLYIRVYQLFLDALASEHGARLLATSAASDWLERRIGTTARTLRALRLESSTQELLDVVSGARQRARATARAGAVDRGRSRR